MFSEAKILPIFLFYDVSAEFHPALSNFEKKKISAHPNADVDLVVDEYSTVPLLALGWQLVDKKMRSL